MFRTLFGKWNFEGFLSFLALNWVQNPGRNTTFFLKYSKLRNTNHNIWVYKHQSKWTFTMTKGRTFLNRENFSNGTLWTKPNVAYIGKYYKKHAENLLVNTLLCALNRRQRKLLSFFPIFRPLHKNLFKVDNVFGSVPNL